MPIPTLFVTATDTEVGKTAVAAALAALLRRRGRNVGVMKPLASGCDTVDGALVAADAVCLARAAGVDDAHELVCPIRLRPPLAPTVAAERDHAVVDLTAVWAARDRLAAVHDCLIVEGIGGIMVPLTADRTVLDVAAEFGAPVLVVARAGLGTINHSLLTVDALRQRGLTVAAVLLNTATNAPHETGGAAVETNPSAIARATGLPVLGPLPWCEGVSVASAELGPLPDALAGLDGVEELLSRHLGA